MFFERLNIELNGPHCRCLPPDPFGVLYWHFARHHLNAVQHSLAAEVAVNRLRN